MVIVHVFGNIDFRTGFSGNRTDGFTALTDNFADFVLADFHREQAWRACGQLFQARNGGFHLIQDVQTRLWPVPKRFA